jgi:hypothetical protein
VALGLGAPALGHVDADAHEAWHAVEDDATPREEERPLRPVLGDEIGLDARGAALEDAGDARSNEGLVVAREEIHGVKVRDFLRRVARHALESLVPSQKAAVLVVEVENARDHLDEAVGEAPVLLASDVISSAWR